MRVFMTLPQIIRVASAARSSKSNYELTLQAPDTADLYTEGDKLQKLIATLPAVNDVTSDLQLRNPRVKIEIDRDKAASLGLNAQDIQIGALPGLWSKLGFDHLRAQRAVQGAAGAAAPITRSIPTRSRCSI